MLADTVVAVVSSSVGDDDRANAGRGTRALSERRRGK